MMNSLVQRLRGQYAVGPHAPNGRPEFGFRQFEAPPIQHEAAARIEELEARLADAVTREEADAMVAAETELCAKAAENWDGFEIAAALWPGKIADRIRSRHPDSRATLDKMLEAARLEGMQEAAQATAGIVAQAVKEAVAEERKEWALQYLSDESQQMEAIDAAVAKERERVLRATLNVVGYTEDVLSPEDLAAIRQEGER